MSLSEGKMFTIEALNRIEGFVWPDKAKFADFDSGGWFVFFRLHEPKALRGSFEGGYIDGSLVDTGVEHPDWRNSLITREEFESVDGWVRNDGSIPDVGGVFDVKFNDGITVKEESKVSDYNWPSTDDNDSIAFWRHHKPQKQEVNPEPESIETMIRRYKDAKENKRAAIDKLNQAQEDVEQAEALEDSLFMAIEAWAEGHGFDIRVLSESEEKPELVITDWRDLQVGDNVLCNGMQMAVFDVCGNGSSDKFVFRARSATNGLFGVYDGTWEFISRPEKK